MMQPGDQQIETLMQVASLLAASGSTLITFVIALLVCVVICTVLMMLDWNRARWGALIPIITIGMACGLLGIGYILYGAAGSIISIDLDAPRVWLGTPYEALATAVKASIGVASGWGVIALTAGLLAIMLSAAVLIRLWLSAAGRRRARLQAATSGSR
jgi:hypothetical protein